jgi:hypothetical protein
MKETKKSAAGRLFYTFGTILLMALVTVCATNFTKNGRAFEMPLLSAVTGTAGQTTSGAVKSTVDYKTIKYKKAETKSTSSAGKKSSAKAAATPAPKVKQPVVNP